MPLIQRKIDISLKIKTAFVPVSQTLCSHFMCLQQLTDKKQVSVVWRRGKRELDSKSGTIDPENHDAKIDDIFKMKTSLDFDEEEYKFQTKMSILELVFSDTKQAIGYVEFDLGSYTNKVRDATNKCVLDLKSD